MSGFRSSWIDRNVYYQEAYSEAEKCPHFTQYERPVIVCLCGSTKFKREFITANFLETMQGKIVLSVGLYSHADATVYTPTEAEKIALDQLHFRKIDLTDEVLVLNCGGYVGNSTSREVLHAEKGNKIISWLKPFAVPPDLAHIGNSLSDGPKVHRDADNESEGS